MSSSSTVHFLYCFAIFQELTLLVFLHASNGAGELDGSAGKAALEGFKQAAPQHATELVGGPLAFIQMEASQNVAVRRAQLHPASTTHRSSLNPTFQNSKPYKRPPMLHLHTARRRPLRPKKHSNEERLPALPRMLAQQPGGGCVTRGMPWSVYSPAGLTCTMFVSSTFVEGKTAECCMRSGIWRFAYGRQWFEDC